MALRIRMQRHGAAHAPVYRMVVTESSHRRDGRHNEILGNYNPKARGQDKELTLKLDRVEYWLSVGAKPSDTARTLINRYRRDTGLVASVPSPQPVKQTETAPAPAAEEAPAEAPVEEAPAAEETAPVEEPKAEEAAPAVEPAAETPAEEKKQG